MIITKILIIGVNRQLGGELHNLLDERGMAYDFSDSKSLDSTDKQMVDAKIDVLQSYTVVDNNEAAKRVGAKLVLY